MPDLVPPTFTSEADLPAVARVGHVVTAPAGLGMPFKVTVPDFDDHEMHAFEIRRWQSRAVTVPKVGDECLVILDDEGEPWVTAWWPAGGDAAIEGGGGGKGDKKYVHEQGVASAEWTIAHGLEKIPSVSLFDSTEQELMGETVIVNLNIVAVRFNAAVSGKGYLN